MKHIIVDGGTVAHDTCGSAYGGWAHRLEKNVLWSNLSRSPSERSKVDIRAQPNRTILDVARDLGSLPLGAESVSALVIAVGADEVYDGAPQPVNPLLFERGLRDITDAVDATDMSLVFVSPQPIQDLSASERRRVVWCSTQLAETADRTGAQYVDTPLLFAPFPDYQIMQPNNTPNALGHEILYQAIVQSLQAVRAL